MNNCVRIMSSFMLCNEHVIKSGLRGLNKEEIKEFVKRQLIKEFSSFLLEKFDELPIKIQSEEKQIFDAIQYDMFINIIEISEYERLSAIEAKYNELKTSLLFLKEANK